MGLLMATPSTSHLNFDNIYEPAEDSYLLLDTLSSLDETTFLQQRFPEDESAPLVVEIGTGSGVVLAFVTSHAGKIFSSSNVMSLGVDVNRRACAATIATVTRAQKELGGPKPSNSCATFLDPIQG